jgi:hypothetical protein
MRGFTMSRPSTMHLIMAMVSRERAAKELREKERAKVSGKKEEVLCQTS